MGPVEGGVADLPKQRPRAGEAPDAELCRAQLARVLASPDFDATDRDRRFLSHVVEESLAGRADRIKAYTIALEVFGRDASFDPQTDPIVRVEAGHLRRALDRYYLSAGRADPLLIGIPKGGYAPRFEPRSLPPAETPEPPVPGPALRRGSLYSAAVLALLLAAAAGFGAGALLGRTGAPVIAAPDVPRLVVEPFETLDGGEAGAAIAASLGAELVTEVARFKDIVMVARASGAEAGAAAPPYRLGGSVAADEGQLRVQARLERQSDGAVLWAENYRAVLGKEPPFAAEARIAAEVATAVGQPYGAIYQAAAAERAVGPKRPGDAYACTLAYFTYRVTLDASSYADARACLEAAVARFPDYATAWALLGQMRLDGLRWGFAPTTPIDEALADARRALMLDPLNVRALQVKMLAMHLGGDIDGALRTGAVALAVNPNDTELMGEYGYRLALAGRWEEGCDLLRRALARNPGPLPYYETGLALCAYIAGDHAEAAARIKATPIQAIPVYHLMAAAFLAEAGDMEAAHRERDWIERRAPNLTRTLIGQVTPLIRRKEDLARFVASLRKAGLDLPGDGTP